jgi:hypothetical protein
MRNISFSLTTDQVRHAFATGEILKDVTRRLGWLKLEEGDRLRACRKCMGRKPGEPLDVLGVIEVVSARRERLNAITDDDVRREGFPGRSREWFIDFFCRTHKDPQTGQRATGATLVTRIEFRYVTSAA